MNQEGKTCWLHCVLVYLMFWSQCCPQAGLGRQHWSDPVYVSGRLSLPTWCQTETSRDRPVHQVGALFLMFGQFSSISYFLIRFNKESLTTLNLAVNSNWVFVGTKRGNTHVLRLGNNILYPHLRPHSPLLQTPSVCPATSSTGTRRLVWAPVPIPATSFTFWVRDSS